MGTPPAGPPGREMGPVRRPRPVRRSGMKAGTACIASAVLVGVLRLGGKHFAASSSGLRGVRAARAAPGNICRSARGVHRRVRDPVRALVATGRMGTIQEVLLVSLKYTMDDGPLPYLDTFAKAAETSSFTAAAQALGLTQ